MIIAVLTAVAIIVLVAVTPLVLRAVKKRQGTFFVAVVSITALVSVCVAEFLKSTYGTTAWLIQLGILLGLGILIRVVAKRLYASK